MAASKPLVDNSTQGPWTHVPSSSKPAPDLSLNAYTKARQWVELQQRPVLKGRQSDIRTIRAGLELVEAAYRYGGGKIRLDDDESFMTADTFARTFATGIDLGEPESPGAFELATARGAFAHVGNASMTPDAKADLLAGAVSKLSIVQRDTPRGLA